MPAFASKPDGKSDHFLEQWRPDKFDPHAWLDLFVRGGAEYFVAELFEAADDYPLKKGVYFSIPEWFHPLGDWAGKGPSNPYTGYRPIADYVQDHQYPRLCLQDREPGARSTSPAPNHHRVTRGAGQPAGASRLVGLAGRAVDGNTDGTSGMARSPTPWNPRSRRGGRLTSARRQTSVRSRCGTAPTAAPAGSRTPCWSPIAETGRYVRIQLKSASDALSLAEMAVYTPVP